ncbi:MAG: D-alanyl-D-alanine carboxypeptidase [candidate division Zixibacteria bacterium]|nr:D-alanyl-D-alanine carboxypeptidase [candidate division Zixibacteria bacterium]
MRRWRRIIIPALAVVAGLAVYVTVTGIGASQLPYSGPSLPSRSEATARQRECLTAGVKFNAQSALVIDNKSSEWVFARNPQQVRPIASLSKVLTAMVYLDSKPDFNTRVTITREDCFESSRSRIYEKEVFKAVDLLHIALVSSDNRAARALAGSTGLTTAEFVQRMNKKALSLGMVNTRMYEPTGLDERNVSTAADVALMINAAMKYPLIKQCMSELRYTCRPLNKNRMRTFGNTNRLLWSKYQVEAGKTGYIEESAYCLATILSEIGGREITVVVLGAPSNGSRFAAARRLADFIFKQLARSGYGNKQIAG